MISNSLVDNNSFMRQGEEEMIFGNESQDGTSDNQRIPGNHGGVGGAGASILQDAQVRLAIPSDHYHHHLNHHGLHDVMENEHDDDLGWTTMLRVQREQERFHPKKSSSSSSSSKEKPLFAWWEIALILGTLIGAAVLVIVLFVIADIGGKYNHRGHGLNSNPDRSSSTILTPGGNENDKDVMQQNERLKRKQNGTRDSIPVLDLTKPPLVSGDNSMTGNNNNAKRHPSPSPTIARGPGYLNELQRLLGGITAVPNSTQDRALQWLVYQDKQFPDYPHAVHRLEQRYALVVFHMATGGWDLRGGWATSSGARQHECLWPGVKCNREDIVQSLQTDVNIGLLNGTIPSEIGLLSNLQTLILANNHLTGDIPSELYSLSMLYSVELTNTKLSATLSPQLSRLPDLVYLNVMHGNFRGTIPSELGQALKLRRFYISHNSGIQGTIPTELGLLTSLEAFYFHLTNISGTIPEQLCRLRIWSELVELRADCGTNSTMTTTATDDVIVNHTTTPAVVCDCCTRCY